MMGFDVGFVPYNLDGWGPPEDVTVPPSLDEGSTSVPFSRFDKLGHFAD
jgi:translation initiation factor 3 subunit D